MKLRIQETLRELGNDTYITADPMDIVKKCSKGNQPYRILYDAQADLYMIGNAWEHIHQELLKFAFQQGWYDSQRKFIEEFVGYYKRSASTDYWCRGIELTDIDEEDELDISLLSDRVDKDSTTIYPWLYCFGFLPVGSSKDELTDFSSDGYNHEYEFPFGTLLTRDFELKEVTGLSRAFSRIK